MEKDGKKLWRLTKQLNDEGSRYSKITLIQDDTLIHGKTAANLFADTYQQASNIHKYTQVTTQQHRETRSQLKIIEEHDDIPSVMDSSISYEELNSALAKLKYKKSPGPAGTQWGAAEAVLRKVYIGTICPHLDYGSTPGSSASKTSNYTLDKVHNQELRLITGSMR